MYGGNSTGFEHVLFLHPYRNRLQFSEELTARPVSIVHLAKLLSKTKKPSL